MTLKNLVTLVAKTAAFNKEIRYVRNCAVYNFIAAAEMTITTHSMLEAVVPPDQRDILNVTYNFLGKDVVSNMLSLSAISVLSRKIDEAPRKSVYISQSLYQLSILTEAMSPALSSLLFVPLIGLAGTGKSLTWAAMGALNAKVISKMCPQQAGKFYSKLTISSVLGNSLGTVFGLSLIKLLPSTQMLALPILMVVRLTIVGRMLSILDE
jgi:hypothetical protein